MRAGLSTLLLFAGVAAPSVITALPPKSIGVHQVGGFDHRVVVRLDGTGRVQDHGKVRVARRPGHDEVVALQQKFLRAGFFSWKSPSASGPAVPDSMATTPRATVDLPGGSDSRTRPDWWVWRTPRGEEA